MAGFDPRAYAEQKDEATAPAAPKAFDPNAYVKNDDDTRAIRRALKLPNEADYPVAIAIPLKAIEGVTLGHADEASGLIETRNYATKELLSGRVPSMSELRDTYKQYRDNWRGESRNFGKVHPVASAVSEIAGGAFGGGLLGKGTAGLGRGASAVIQGAVGGLGSSESSSPLGVATDAAIGGAVGGVLDKGARMIAPTAREVKNYAAEKAVKASGAMTKQFRELKNRGLLGAQGEWLLENGVVKAGSSLEDVSERSGALRSQAGETIGSVIDNVDSLRTRAISIAGELVDHGLAGAPQADRVAARKTLQDGINREFGYNFQNVADKIRGLAERDSQIGAAAFHRQKLDYLANVFEDIAQKGPGTLRTGLRNKTEQRRLLKDVDSLGEEYKQEIYDIISHELDRAVGNTEKLAAGVEKMVAARGGGGAAARPGGRAALEQGAPQLPTAGGEAGLAARPPAPSVPDLPGAERAAGAGGKGGAFGVIGEEASTALERFKGANRDYAAAATAQKTADHRLGQVMSNRDYGLTTAIATNAGMLLGGAPAAAGMGVINNLARKYGSSVQADLAWKVGTLLERQPEAFGKYGPDLRDALRRGTQQFLIANEVVAKDDPAYAQFLEQMAKEDANARGRGDAMGRRLQGGTP